jgi:death-on-curing protein
VSEPLWLTLAQVLLIHKKMIDSFGGTYGIREVGLLHSALARPRNFYYYQHADLFDCAAAYAHGIACNHPFLDGNKRTAFTSAGLFLRQNGISLKPQALYDTVMVKVVENKMGRAELANYLRDMQMS